jgi:pilus assembly protein CpaB
MKRQCALVLGALIANGVATRDVAASGPEIDGINIEAVPKVRVLVAKKNLALGTVIKDPQKYFSEERIAPSPATKGTFRRLDEVNNLKLNKPIAAGEVLTPYYILSDADSLALKLPPDHVAVTFTTNPERIGSGCILPMDRGDLVLTIELDDGSASSVIILRNALILETDEFAVQSGKGTKLVMTVTLAVPPRQVRRLRELSSWGELRILLVKQK